MAIIYSELNDGYCTTGPQSSFVAARSHAGAYVSSSTTNGIVCMIIALPGRGGGAIHDIRRGFFEFDTSGISVAPSSADLKIYGSIGGGADVIAVRSEQSATLATGDYDALYGASSQLAATDGAGAGTLAGVSGLTYSAEIATWSTSGYNTIPLNATALADIASLSTFKVCLMEYDKDYLDIAAVPFHVVQTGCYFANNTGTSKDPHIDYTAGTAAAAVENATFFGTNF